MNHKVFQYIWQYRIVKTFFLIVCITMLLQYFGNYDILLGMMNRKLIFTILAKIV
jgi:hypothetical protein